PAAETPAAVGEASAPAAEKPAPVGEASAPAVADVPAHVATPASGPVEAAAPAFAPMSAPAEEPVRAASAPASAAAAQAIVVPRSDNREALAAMVGAAGMQWVETDPARLEQAQRLTQAAPVRLGREPRIPAPVSHAPLQQVETRR